MQILVDTTGTKREIRMVGLGLKAAPGYELFEGIYNLAGKSKSNYWYVVATNKLEEKTTAEKAAYIAKKISEQRAIKARDRIIEIIQAATTLADLKTRVAAIMNGG
jgi:hypothetical protein